ncbi:Uu.00g001220.m01.CDS01 [Anthostomella pinea]|uniref:Uu.00g001220.m01.CDS01 n=1 Tax=Anthostomella pinea TaxID=933095 RepID=A0AAI8VE13_9PEZI|nr:Uu.00g001220.m01.CDS01 [Anthostomella pinea]
MSFKKHSRQYDLVIFGATGYTGLMVAEFIAAHFPTDVKWAVAGRSVEKLESVVKSCNAVNPDRQAPGVEICNLDDAELSELAKKTFVLITTVGPYSQYGEHAFKACAEAGTHYLDCTGEVTWHQVMLKKYNAAAKASGACMFPQSGIESAPSDLIAFSLASLIKSKLSTGVGDVVVDLHELNAKPSGGTMATVIGIFETFSWKEVVDSHKPFALSPEEPSLRNNSYGPNFTYREFTKARNFVTAMAMHYSLLIGATLLMFCSPVRKLVRKLVFQPGMGPTREDAAKEYIEFRGIATPDAESKSGKQAICKAWYAGSMYYLTATVLCEGARTLLEDDVGLAGGVYTPACLGQAFIDRLHDSGFKFETKILDT